MKIWAGGPEVSYHAEAFLKEEPAVDIVMMGEGEITFAHFLKALLEGEELKQVPGLMLRNDDGTITDTGFRQVMDMSQIPFPYAFMDMKELEHRIIYYESSRGCPFPAPTACLPLTRSCAFAVWTWCCRSWNGSCRRKCPR